MTSSEHTNKDVVLQGAPIEPADPGQFSLLGQRKFLPLFLTQFLGAFNDNVFKSALSLLFVYGGLVALENQDIVVNLAAALFILPFFMFSALAGQLADKYPKEFLIRRIKILEILIAAFGAVAVFSGSVGLMLTVLFLLGLQSTFFGPLKFSILPQHLKESELIGGNAQIEMGTFVSILLGTLVGGVIAGQADAGMVLTILIITVAVGGYFACRYIPHAPAADPDLLINWNFFSETRHLIGMAMEKRSIMLSILGISWFWLIGSVLLAQFPGLTERVLLGDTTVVTLILCVFTLSIAVGSLACEGLSGHHIEIGLVPLGALGIALAGLDMYFSVEQLAALARGLPHRDWLAFLEAPGSVRLLIDFAFIGVFGGIFIVPLYAFIQANTSEDRRARIIAVNNIINSILMVLGNLFAIVMLEVANSGIPTLLLTVIVMHIVVTTLIFRQLPVFTVRFLVWVLGHTLYRVQHENLDLIPAQGGALLVSNHASYVDALLLAGAVRRPIRFVVFKPIYQLPVLNFVLRTGGAILINKRDEEPEVHEDAFRQIAAGLAAGDLLCVFPEGRPTQEGEVGEFKVDIEKIVATTPVPVVPMALRGVWGSWFSSRNGPRGSKRQPFRKVAVAASEPVPPGEVRAEVLREQVLALRGDMA